ncbi:hypothetical protein E2C01_099696 [Portunus trituberculatus]|uniref:Uncharacterized protein n=1 Tax=Portunus trituberculatus TaxID=210409 RepID=A0A5B7KFK5_PORTR|nr:hypothetical protein [Portunus trituberculatus]
MMEGKGRDEGCCSPLLSPPRIALRQSSTASEARKTREAKENRSGSVGCSGREGEPLGGVWGRLGLVGGWVGGRGPRDRVQKAAWILRDSRTPGILKDVRGGSRMRPMLRVARVKDTATDSHSISSTTFSCSSSSKCQRCPLQSHSSAVVNLMTWWLIL